MGLDFVQNTSISRRLRVVAQDATLEEVANGKSRGILDCNQTRESTNPAFWDSAIFDKRVSRRSSPKRRTSANALDIHETVAAANLQSQSLNIA